MVNSTIQLCKKLVRRSLSWYSRPLQQIHAGLLGALQDSLVVLQHQANSIGALQHITSETARFATTLSVETAALRDELAGVRAELGRTWSEVRGVHDELAKAYGQISSLRSQVEELRLQGRLRDRDFRRVLHILGSELQPKSGEAPGLNVPPMFASWIKGEQQFDYFRFEELYRGNEGLIYGRQRQYLELFEGHDNILDVGCGRGEFLELLRDNGIAAHGVESGTDPYLLCREKKLDVTQQDLFTYLESVEDGSLGGLFSAQVIEHLAAGDQLRLISLAHQKTRAGSPVVFETINAGCVFAILRNFFLDPTHVRPVHPETLKFAMESLGFEKVQLKFSSPLSERWIPPLTVTGDSPELGEFNRAISQVNELLYGYLDYAAIGWR